MWRTGSALRAEKKGVEYQKALKKFDPLFFATIALKLIAKQSIIVRASFKTHPPTPRGRVS